MRLTGNLFYDTEEGERHLLAEFDVEASDAMAAENLVLDEYWDDRLDSACCVPVIKYTRGQSAICWIHQPIKLI